MKISWLQDYLEVVNDIFNAWHIPGLSLGIIVNDDVVINSYGVRGFSDSKKVDQHTLYRIGSITKTFITSALALLVQEGLVSWNDKLIDILPDFKLADENLTKKVTITDILSHRVGLPMFSSSLFAFIGYSLQDIIEHLKYISPRFSCETKFQYHNGLYCILAIVIEKLSGMTWQQFIQKRILSELNMTETCFSLSEYLSSSNHCKPTANFKGEDKEIQFGCFADNVAPAGSMSTSIVDLSKWALFNLQSNKTPHMFSSKIISDITSAYIEIPLAKQEPPDKVFKVHSCGLAWHLFSCYGENGIEHKGGIPGFSSLISLLPSKHVGIVLLCNKMKMASSALSAIRLSFYNFFLEKENRMDWKEEFLKIDEKNSRARKELINTHIISPSPEDLSSFVGIYENSTYGLVHVLVSENKRDLYINIGKNAVSLILAYIGNNKFVFNADDDLQLIYYPSEIVFYPDKGVFKMILRIESGGVFELSTEEFVKIPEHRLVR